MPRAFATGAGLVTTVAAVMAAAGLATSCGSSSPPKVDAATLLEKARQTLDAAPSVRFSLTSSGVAASGTNLVSGKGDIVRPDGLQGTFGVTISGFTANVEVASLGGVFEAKLPFSGRYEKTSPSNFGLTDPAQLIDPHNGVVKLLTLSRDPAPGREERISGELLDTVSYDVPGTDVPVLPDDDPSQPVHLTVAVDPSSDQLRSVRLVGPLTSASSNSTYTVKFTDYGEHVTVRLPPAG